MTTSDAGQAGTFTVGGAFTVNRLGFGAMRLVGEGIWGEPEDREASLRILRRARELGIDFVDTSDAYGPDVSERLIREALHPYDGLLVATKGGLTNPSKGEWVPLGRPEYLIQQARKSLAKLGVERIDLWQLHYIDPKVPRDEQFGAIRTLLDEGVIAHVGLSNVSVDDIEAARLLFPVATVQNRFSLVDRAYDAVLDHCERLKIGFMPWFPLANGALGRPGSPLDAVARAHGAAPNQVAIAWLLKRSPVMLPIPGTSRLEHLEANVAAASLRLSDEEFAALDRGGRAQFEKDGPTFLSPWIRR